MLVFFLTPTVVTARHSVVLVRVLEARGGLPCRRRPFYPATTCGSTYWWRRQLSAGPTCASRTSLKQRERPLMENTCEWTDPTGLWRESPVIRRCITPTTGAARRKLDELWTISWWSKIMTVKFYPHVPHDD